jgi:hypothetical protein
MIADSMLGLGRTTAISHFVLILREAHGRAPQHHFRWPRFPIMHEPAISRFWIPTHLAMHLTPTYYLFPPLVNALPPNAFLPKVQHRNTRCPTLAVASRAVAVEWHREPQNIIKHI